MTGLRQRGQVRWVVLAGALAIAAFAAAEARAAFPGANGKIVFRTNRDGNAEIYTMNADGSNRVNLTRNPAEDVDPRWSADGTRVVFASNRGGNYDIYTMNADGSGVTRLTDTPATDRRPAWTADGKILFHSGAFPTRVISMMNADGSGVHALTPAGSDNAYPTASPRGNGIVFTHLGDGAQRLYTMSSAGGPMRLVTPGPADSADAQANWSPRGSELVFGRFGEEDADLFVVRVNGGGVRQLTDTPNRIEFEPAWSPDGTTIVFHACTSLGTPSQHCANYAINADGTGEREVSLRPQAPYVDEFSGDWIDTFWAQPFLTGTGPSVAQANGRLEFSLPASTLNDPVAGYANLMLTSACRLHGDFDLRVDYELLQWPAPQLINLNFETFDLVDGQYAGPHGMFVFDPGGGTGISTHFPGANTFVPAPELSGSLRLDRVGSTLTAYRLVGGQWVALQSTTDSVDEVGIGLSIFSSAPQFSHGDVKAAFDNFRVAGGTLACPTWWDDNAPDWQAVPAGATP